MTLTYKTATPEEKVELDTLIRIVEQMPDRSDFVHFYFNETRKYAEQLVKDDCENPKGCMDVIVFAVAAGEEIERRYREEYIPKAKIIADNSGDLPDEQYLADVERCAGIFSREMLGLKKMHQDMRDLEQARRIEKAVSSGTAAGVPVRNKLTIVPKQG